MNRLQALLALREAGIEQDFAIQLIESASGTPLSEHEKSLLRSTQPGQAAFPVVVRASEIEPREVEWLWPQRIPRYMLSLLAGDPGLGKSYIAYDLAARISTGRAWPVEEGCQEPATVLILQCEDAEAHTVVPRLIDLEANLENVILVGSVIKRCRSVSWDLRRDAQMLGSLVSTWKPVLVVIDPIAAYVGSGNTNDSSVVRSILVDLAAIAEEHGCAMLIISHFSKADRENALYRVVGSISWIAAARMAWSVVRDPDVEGRCLFVPVKHNIVPRPSSLSYELRDGKLIWQPATGPSTLASVCAREQGRKQAAIEQWLIDQYRGQTVSSESIYEAARSAGHPRRSIQRALAETATVLYQGRCTLWVFSE